MGEVLHGLLSFLREIYKWYYEKEVVVVSNGCEPHHLRLVSHRKYDRATLGRELNRTRPHFLFFFRTNYKAYYEGGLYYDLETT